jgi:CO/xanthine dehydrogenase Mo-binding subunit
MTTYYGIESGEEYKPWLWKVPENAKYIGKPGILRHDGYIKASGKALYSADKIIPGTLYARPLTSPYAHARIVSMDSKAAEALPGVRKVIRWDTPGIIPGVIKNEASTYDLPVGAMVIADSDLICNEALNLIRQNTEWEELPFSVDWDTVLDPNSPLIFPDQNPKSNLIYERKITFGDVEEGLQKADNILEWEKRDDIDSFMNAGSVQSLTNYDKSNNTLEVIGNNQFPYQVTPIYLMMTGVPFYKIKEPDVWRAGTFGGGSSTNLLAAQWSALASMYLDKPVSFSYDGRFERHAEDFGTTKITVGYNDDGTITAIKVWNIQACELEDHIQKINKGLKCENLEITYLKAFSNIGEGYACYKHGAYQCGLHTEVLAHVAEELNMDPTELALINDGCYGHSMEWIKENIKTKYGFDASRDSLKEVLAIGKEAIGWNDKWHAPGTKILPSGNYHGIGFSWQIAWHHRPDDSNARYWDSLERFDYGPIALRVMGNGNIKLTASLADVGINRQSTYAAIIADEVGVNIENVWIYPADEGTFTVRIGGGSRGLTSNSTLLIRAARKLKNQILETALYFTDANGKLYFESKTKEDLDIIDGEIFEIANPSNKFPLASMAAFQFVQNMNDKTNKSRELVVTDAAPIIDPELKAYTMCRQAYFMEVEVNPDTGRIIVNNLVVVNDVGKIISPETIRGQQLGGSYMGFGRSCTEELIWDSSTGVRLNDDLINYPAALIDDIPGKIDCYAIETGLGWAPYGMYGVAESAAAVGATLTRYAVHNAIGKWVNLKTTPAKILKALGKA